MGLHGELGLSAMLKITETGCGEETKPSSLLQALPITFQFLQRASSMVDADSKQQEAKRCVCGGGVCQA